MKSYLAILCVAALILSPTTNAKSLLGNIGKDISILSDLLSGSETRVEKAIDQIVEQNAKNLNQITNQAVQNINQTASGIIANIDQAAAQSGEAASQIGMIAYQGGQKISAMAHQAGLDIGNVTTKAGKKIGLFTSIFCYKASTSDCQDLVQKAVESGQTLGQQVIAAASELTAAATSAGLSIEFEVENVSDGLTFDGYNTNISRGVSLDDIIAGAVKVAENVVCTVINAATGIACGDIGASV